MQMKGIMKGKGLNLSPLVVDFVLQNKQDNWFTDICECGGEKTDLTFW